MCVLLDSGVPFSFLLILFLSVIVSSEEANKISY